MNTYYGSIMFLFTALVFSSCFNVAIGKWTVHSSSGVQKSRWVNDLTTTAPTAYDSTAFDNTAAVNETIVDHFENITRNATLIHSTIQAGNDTNKNHTVPSIYYFLYFFFYTNNDSHTQPHSPASLGPELDSFSLRYPLMLLILCAVLILYALLVIVFCIVDCCRRRDIHDLQKSLREGSQGTHTP
uniref:Membrane protein n=1 Tax=Otarine gammaherpesvirus 4 TaxID=2801541 RepID=A0A889IVZ7_9GAMA|nr:Membrane protein [Otarine gammaherpesvirus 4]